MENKDKAASEYTEECNSRTPIATNNSFCAGAEWAKTQMQSEIDELREALEEFHNLLEEHMPIWYLMRHHAKANKLLEKYGKK